MIQRRALISGKVQGVGFRAATADEASRIGGLSGFVRNLPDGRVEAVFLGEESKVLEICAWCTNGPPSARVENVELTEEEPDPSLPPFSIRRGE